jgi:putative aldouronate transport system permease protein
MSIQNNIKSSALKSPGETFFSRLYNAIKLEIQRDYLLYLMIAPMVIWFLVFLYKPMLGLQIAFKDFSLWKGIAGSDWVGLEHFRTLFADDYFLQAIKNTFIIAFYMLFFQFPIPVIIAIMFNEYKNTIWKRGAQTLVYLPHFISVVVLAGVVVSFLSPSTGVVNAFLRLLGFEEIYFMAMPEFFRPIFVGSNIWKEAGFESIVYMAAIAGINPELYEVARVDGASRLKIMRHVTLPCILPTVMIMFIIKIGAVIELGWEYIILLYQPTTYETADVIQSFVYRVGLQGSQYDIAAAAGLFNGIVAFTLVIIANRISKKISQTSLW